MDNVSYENTKRDMLGFLVDWCQDDIDFLMELNALTFKIVSRKGINIRTGEKYIDDSISKYSKK